MVFWWYSVLSVALSCFLKVKGETTRTVQVGLQGSFFDPSYVVAQVDDIISFVFSGNMHSVTQSTFENPCLALPGGFNSGLAGKGANGTGPVPVWNLRITNSSAPIWYFCQIASPRSHCNAGMVGVINPPNISLFTQFQSSARLMSGTPTPSFAVVLTGVGAIATASPSDLSTTLPTPTSISTSSSSSIAPATTTVIIQAASTPRPSNSSAIVGGAVGGVLGLLLILVALFWVLQQRKSRNKSGIPSHDRFVSVSTLGRQEMGQTISRADTLSPVRRASPSQRHTIVAPIPITPQFDQDHQPSFGSAAISHVRSPSEPQSNINIQSLAQDVAAVLRQTPGLEAYGVKHQHANSSASLNVDAESRAHDARRPENRADREHDREHGETHLTPPHYRATVSPSGERLLPRER